jgi:hypothetical protein
MTGHWRQVLIRNYSTLIFLLLWLIVGQAQAALTARLDRDRITEGETVRLQVEAQGQVSGSPDTTPLQTDFEVLGISSGSRVNIINGRMESSTSWTISLSPKHGGKLTIPSLELDGEQTRPLTLLVSKTPVASDATGGSPIFIETEVNPSDPYVQGMVRYRVRLFYQAKLLEGSLSEPEPNNALVHRLGKDREYSAERNGRRYQVIERRYAIFPQASGKLELPAPVLDAKVPDQSKQRRSPMQDFFGRDPFIGGSRLGDMFTSSRPVRVRGESKMIQVRPRPAQAASHPWLPAQSVSLSESWQPEGGELRVGDPITRSITLRARGVTGEQLPELEPGQVDGFKVYPDRPQVATQDLDQTVQGEMIRNIAFVPVRPGRFTLPPMQVHWWDTDSDRERMVELPEHRVKILPAAPGQVQTAPPSTTPEPTPENRSPQSAPAQMPPQPGVLNIGSGAGKGGLLHAGFWPWISLLFALLWLATLGVWWRSRSQAKSQVKVGERNAANENAAKAKARFQSACRANGARQARYSLLDWAAAHWPDDPPRGLDELAQRLSDQTIRQALSELDQALYAGTARSWDGSALAKALTKLPKPGRTAGGKAVLPGLYA